MHFKGILKNPNSPKIVIFQPEQPVQPTCFSNGNFVDLSKSNTFFKDFINSVGPKEQVEEEALKKTESELWRDFKNYFSTPNRPITLRQTHHDFI